ncbi:hypothetical protein EYF80_045486 [Liparis tanakae]|uniref:Uncharacterized protein n=1 Tax=Liparis tanakae TaxID=230148 RepID=A0A4Z2FU71_9TELE|nr:hypothetical protein EYF80_045486 [Liparis tanakae]
MTALTHSCSASLACHFHSVRRRAAGFMGSRGPSTAGRGRSRDELRSKPHSIEWPQEVSRLTWQWDVWMLDKGCQLSASSNASVHGAVV